MGEDEELQFMEVYSNILNGSMRPFPKRLQEPVRQLISGLLQKSPTDRLTSKMGGLANVKQHTFYEEFDWEALEQKSMEPPIIPEPVSWDAMIQRDLSRFSTLDSYLQRHPQEAVSELEDMPFMDF